MWVFLNGCVDVPWQASPLRLLTEWSQMGFSSRLSAGNSQADLGPTHGWKGGGAPPGRRANTHTHCCAKLPPLSLLSLSPHACDPQPAMEEDHEISCVALWTCSQTREVLVGCTCQEGRSKWDCKSGWHERECVLFGLITWSKTWKLRGEAKGPGKKGVTLVGFRWCEDAAGNSAGLTGKIMGPQN